MTSRSLGVHRDSELTSPVEPPSAGLVHASERPLGDTIDGVSDHKLLIRHASEWAASKKRPLDEGLLETALGLREFHEHESAIEWTAGNVEHLLMVRWPAHGPLEAPDPQSLVDTLDTYWRFLRATGRMSAKSDDPKALTKVARRAVRDLPERSADPAHQSQTKVLQQFGRDIGIALDGAANADEVGERWQRITDAWNALSIEERQARMPVVGPVGSQAFPTMSELLGSVDSELDRPGFESDTTYGDALLDDTPLPRPEPRLVAAEARESVFVRDCLRLAEWVGVRRQVTSNGVLRLADAELAYEELGLAAWEGHWFGEHERALQPSAWTFQSAGDCLPLDRLWIAAATAGLLHIRATVAAAVPDERPRSDEQWCVAAISLLLGLVQGQKHRIDTGPLLLILGTALMADSPSRVSDLADLWAQSEQEQAGRAVDDHHADIWRDVSDWRFWQIIGLFDDTGIWLRTEKTLTVSALGRSFGLILIRLLDDGQIEL